jgi:outer membrane protein assembly factor BamB
MTKKESCIADIGRVEVFMPTTSNGRPKSRRTKIEVAIAIAVASIITVGLVVTYSTDRAEVRPSLNQPSSNNNNNSDAVSSTSVSSSSTTSTASSPEMINFIISRDNNSLFLNPADNEEWLTYHHDSFRTAFDSYISKPAFSHSSPFNKNWTSTNLDGAVYAEPLVARGRVFVATENNSIYSLDANTGKVIWRTNLGPPVPLSDLPCGDIDPTGITGTPIIDLRTQTIFAVAFLNDTHRHELFALDIGTGKIRFETAIDPPSSDPLVQQQRAALALNYYTEGSNKNNSNSTTNGVTISEGREAGRGIIVYVPFGGLFGDCGQYHGWMVGAPISYASLQGGSNSDSSNNKRPLPLLSFKVPTSREGGIWAPSGPAIDNNGNIFVTTGNSESSSNFDFGNTVIKLPPEMGKVIGWFAPSNWADLDTTDTDLGSVGPAILDNNLGNKNPITNSSSFSIFQIGKEGVGYILRGEKLGEMGGQIFSAPVCDGGAYGGTAYVAPYLYVACRDGLVSLNLHSSAQTNTTTASMNNTYSSFAIRWRGPQFWAGPPIVVDGLVWTVDIDNGGLYAFDLSTGNILFHENLGQVTHFATPSSAHGKIFVAAYDRIVSFSIK